MALFLPGELTQIPLRFAPLRVGSQLFVGSSTRVLTAGRETWRFPRTFAWIPYLTLIGLRTCRGRGFDVDGFYFHPNGGWYKSEHIKWQRVFYYQKPLQECEIDTYAINSGRLSH